MLASHCSIAGALRQCCIGVLFMDRATPNAPYAAVGVARPKYFQCLPRLDQPPVRYGAVASASYSSTAPRLTHPTLPSAWRDQNTSNACLALINRQCVTAPLHRRFIHRARHASRTLLCSAYARVPRRVESRRASTVHSSWTRWWATALYISYDRHAQARLPPLRNGTLLQARQQPLAGPCHYKRGQACADLRCEHHQGVKDHYPNTPSSKAR